jgi:pyruvate dehydrogenase (quinone)
MAQTCGEFLLRRLMAWGVTRIYGYPGDGITGIMAGFAELPELKFVQVRHEEMAAFMACGHAKFTGEVGVCLATSGPGAIHLLNGLYDAKMDHAPVVAIVGQSARAAIGGDYQQEVDLLSLFKDVAHEYVHVASDPAQIRHLVDRAVRIALADRTVTCVIVPHDVQQLPAVEKPKHMHSTVHTGIGYARPRVIPMAADLARAADVLNEGSKVAMLIGAGAMSAADEVVEMADLLGAGVAKALLGKAAVPDDLPFVTGSIGLLGTRPSWEMMKGCDTLLMVGTAFPYPEFLPEEGQARGVQIDISPRMLSLRYPMEVPLAGDSAETLRALIPLIRRKTDRGWRSKIEASIADWWKVVEARAMNTANPLNPARVFWELSPRLPERSILCGDSGSHATWFARDLKIRRGMMASISGNLATMGPAMPYAIAAKFCHPGRVAIAVVGDGSMQMNGMNELITVAKYWREWKDPRLVVLVLNNRDLNMVTWEQRALAGDPKFSASQDIPDFPYARFAEMCGLVGVKVDKPEALADAWDRVLYADRPAVLEAYVDPDVPPLPPHITWSQASQYMAAILKGDPDASGILTQSWKGLIESFLPKNKA